MKKIFVPIVVAVVIISAMLCACTNSNVNIESTSWQLQTAIRAYEGGLGSEIIARRHGEDSSDGEIPEVDDTLTAKDGAISIIDAAPAERPRQIFQPFVRFSGVDRIQHRDLIGQDHVRIVRHALRHGILALEQIESFIITTDINDILHS